MAERTYSKGKKSVSDSLTESIKSVRYEDINGVNRLFGGRLMEWIDETAGIAALLFEWAIIRDNQPFFTGSSVKYYLQRGARREENMQYPNPEWGYGKVDLYHTFELLT